MNIKKLLVIDEKPVAIKFNPLKMQLMLGGPNKSYTTILMLLENYFKLSADVEVVRNSKCRLVVQNCKRSDYSRGIEAIEDEGLILTDVSTFERIMR